MKPLGTRFSSSQSFVAQHSLPAPARHWQRSKLTEQQRWARPGCWKICRRRERHSSGTMVARAGADLLFPLALSTLAGLSTTIGGAVAVVRKPSQATMAGLLGVAIGVMATVSIVELIVRNAMENDPFLVLASAGSGALLYYVLEPLFPSIEEEDLVKKEPQEAQPLLLGGDGDVEGGSVTNGRQTTVSSSALRKKLRGVVWLRLPWTIKGLFRTCTQTESQGGTANAATSTSAGSGGGGGGTSASLSSGRAQADGGGAGASSSTAPAALMAQSSTSRQQLAPASSTGQAQASLAHQLSSSQHAASAAAGAGLLTASRAASLQAGGAPFSEGLGGGGGGDGQGLAAASEPHPAWLHAASQHLPAGSSAHQASLLRLGLLMAITMTLHNIPEGFAVAFSAFEDRHFGLVMAAAIALHNIPEGVIIAAPIYAATGSRWKALGLATASGLSEPLGAALALVLLHPFITPSRLHYLLAGVGGLMLAVCVIELWPEAKACRNDRALAIGALLGAVVMGWTLAVEG